MIARLTLRRAVSAAALLGLVPAVPAAAAPVRFSIETGTRLGYDLNPFLTTGNDLASGYVESSVAPKISKRTEKGEVALSGHFDRTAYLEKYGKSDEYGGKLDLQQRVTPKLNVFGALRYDSEVIGQGDDNVTGAPIDNTDVTLIGLRRRSDTYAASGGFQYQATPKDMISVDGGYTATRYGAGAGGDSDNVGGRIAWQHALNQRSKIGISGAVYRIDYDTPGMSTLIMEPRVTFSTELSATWHFDASLGVSFSDLSLPTLLGPDQRSNGLSGSVNLCHKGTRDDFCFYAARSVSASGAGGTVESSQLGYTYSRKLTERLGFASGASYSRSESQSGLVPTREYVSAHAGFDFQVTRQIRIGTEGRYRDVFGGTPVKAGLGGELYATLVFPGSQ